MPTLAKTSEEIFLDEINRKNIEQFVLEDLTFGTPRVTSENGRNTSVVVTALETSPWYGNVEVWYDRVDMTEVFQAQGVGEVLVDARGASTVHELIPTLNLTYGLNLKPADLVDAPLDFRTFPAQLEINAGPNSLVWIGGLDATLVQGDVWLKYVIKVTELNGFYPPDYD